MFLPPLCPGKLIPHTDRPLCVCVFPCCARQAGGCIKESSSASGEASAVSLTHVTHEAGPSSAYASDRAIDPVREATWAGPDGLCGGLSSPAFRISNSLIPTVPRRRRRRGPPKASFISLSRLSTRERSKDKPPPLRRRDDPKAVATEALLSKVRGASPFVHATPHCPGSQTRIEIFCLDSLNLPSADSPRHCEARGGLRHLKKKKKKKKSILHCNEPSGFYSVNLISQLCQEKIKDIPENCIEKFVGAAGCLIILRLSASVWMGPTDWYLIRLCSSVWMGPTDWYLIRLCSSVWMGPTDWYLIRLCSSVWMGPTDWYLIRLCSSVWMGPTDWYLIRLYSSVWMGPTDWYLIRLFSRVWMGPMVWYLIRLCSRVWMGLMVWYLIRLFSSVWMGPMVWHLIRLYSSVWMGPTDWYLIRLFSSVWTGPMVWYLIRLCSSSCVGPRSIHTWDPVGSSLAW